MWAQKAILSSVQAHNFLSNCRYSTTRPRKPTVELLASMSLRFPLRKSEEKCSPVESRTPVLRLRERTSFPLDQSSTSINLYCSNTGQHCSSDTRHGVPTRWPYWIVVSARYNLQGRLRLASRSKSKTTVTTGQRTTSQARFEARWTRLQWTNDNKPCTWG